MLLCSSIFVPLDVSRFWFTEQPGRFELSEAAKLTTSFLATVIAWTLAEHEVEPGDSRRFRQLFTLVFVADTCFIAGQKPIGVMLFFVFQLMLIHRNLLGLRPALPRLPRARLALLVGAFTAASLFVATTLTPHLPNLVLRVGLPLYLAAVTVSVIAAWVAVWIGRFPARNAALMRAGMTCFFLCDLTVGINFAVEAGSSLQLLASSLTWLFYAPALALVATSGTRLELRS
jgi:hypothetical protein